jgi:hypothetical protein
MFGRAFSHRYCRPSLFKQELILSSERRIDPTYAYFDDIKSLKAGQMLNCEIIQSLAESVSDLASVISRVQGNEVKNNSNFSKNTEKSDVEQSEYANFANTKSSFVLEELTVRL